MVAENLCFRGNCYLYHQSRQVTSNLLNGVTYQMTIIFVFLTLSHWMS